MCPHRNEVEKHAQYERQIMSEDRFACSLQFTDAWRATSEQIDTLLVKMTESLLEDNVSGLTLSGTLADGSLDVFFDSPVYPDGKTGGAVLGLVFVVRALNRGRVSVPGWPDDDAVDGAIASVSVNNAVMVPNNDLALV
jgi:hypothetical protein